METKHCYICNTPSDFYNNLSGAHSKYTKTPICDFIEIIVGDLSTEREQCDDSIVCIECVGKIDEYDLACQTVQRVENELREMLLRPKDAVVDPIDISINDDEVNVAEATENASNLHGPYQLREVKAKINYDDDSSDIQVIEEPETEFTCNNCKAIFISCKEYNKHKRMECINPHTSQKKAHECRICGESLKTRRIYEGHMREHKLERNEYKCRLCKMYLKEQTALDEHMKLHKDLSPFQCVFCARLFQNKSGLIRHTSTIHSPATFYQCDRCGKDFVHKSSFTSHLLAHDNIRKSECTECGKCFRSTSHLKRHLRSHTGVKPYSCPVCNKKFAQRYNMNVHLRTTHDTLAGPKEPEKVHICKFCERRFQRKSKLLQHLQTKHRVIQESE